MSLYVKLVIALFYVILQAAGAPHQTLYADGNVQRYLTQFGYLPETDPKLQSLRTESQLIEAIKELQRFGGIPVTGKIDEATIRLMKARRCALPDKPDSRFSAGANFNGIHHRRQKRYAIHGQKWDHTNLTWSLRTPRPRGLEVGGVRVALGQALDLWAVNSKLTFKEVNSDYADILVYFERGNHHDGHPFDGRGQVLAHAFFPGPQRGGDAHFDEDEAWLLEDDLAEEGTSLYTVAAHEFGHSLGLDHTSEQGALMYAWYQGFSRNDKLPEDDRIGIQQMYGSPQDRLWGPYNPGTHDRTWPRPRPRPQPTTTTTTTIRPWRTRPTWPTRPVRPTRPYDYPKEPWGRRPEKPNHRIHRPETPTKQRPDNNPRYHPRTDNSIPKTCDTSYDAISVIRNEIFIFKDRYFWRVSDKGLMPGYPVEITRFFNFTQNIHHVDAVYEGLDKKIVFFVGRHYYVFSGSQQENGYPRPLTDLGLPAQLTKIDGAMIWGYNQRTYFFSGHLYWRFDEAARRVELDYPRDMAMFAGVSPNIDAVFQAKNAKTYFFKGKGFWEFDDLRMRVKKERQTLSAPVWMHCPRVYEDEDEDENSNLPQKDRITAVNSSTQTVATLYGFVFICAVILRL
ncbi:matrix metalloproteinase-2 [Neodiprion lecontei]|uniref:Matrix metalloproteinase-2 n=1 Tax=Neodiprion lecontei TaxID=441921 RepID=A0A6J0CBW3_NEOLC|nr:matrix metalloproteinase-2 [Neodiprion lecontei]